MQILATGKLGTTKSQGMNWLFAATFIMLFSSLCAADNGPLQFNNIVLNIAGKALNLEYADTWELRAMGLQHRKELCQDCGMLFNFNKSRPVSMWMKNTYIPLDVAFIAATGEITDIKAMQPLDLTSVGSSKPVKYALEMNQGWFKKHDVNVGDAVMMVSIN